MVGLGSEVRAAGGEPAGQADSLPGEDPLDGNLPLHLPGLLPDPPLWHLQQQGVGPWNEC